MALNADLSSASSSYGVGSPSSYYGTFAASMGSAFNKIFDTDFGLTNLGNAIDNAVNRDFNASQAQLNREFQTNMSNTAYQRAVKDMKLAGINPILAFSSGAPSASTPSGSSTSYSGVGNYRLDSNSGSSNLMGVAKIVAGAYTSNPVMVASGFTDVTSRNGNDVIHTRRYIYNN